MGKRKDWVVQTILGFFNFQDNFMNGVVAKAIPWKIDATEITALQDLQTPYLAAFNKVKNKKTATSADRDEYDLAQAAYESAIRGFTRSFITGNKFMTNSNRDSIGVPNVNLERHRRKAITTAPFAELKAEGGGVIDVKARVEADSSRPSVHEDADTVTMNYVIGAQPVSIKDCTNTAVSKKASFRLHLDPDLAGKKLYGYLTWTNNSDSSKSGPISKLYQCVISD